ncbi:hypothetical protein CLV40_10364 [Actinokineospora auranticolor]|uniref:Uncharacterized protein n=1 Tax=Actinokineospora auranticolor TaxID=155976 RepID=A0A2S6GW87_9PSEU|nr:hypothetical protein CLV40_10364 [Actinokineospora auranticolor]
MLAAAVYEAPEQERARAAMLELRGARRIRKSHWHEMDEQERARAVRSVVGLGGSHVVVVGSPVPCRRQERARAKCLERLVFELHGLGVTALVMEGRSIQLNGRDVHTITGARHNLPKATEFHVSHVLGKDEPLFWVADIVAGAVRAATFGQGHYHAELAPQIFQFMVSTGC